MNNSLTQPLPPTPPGLQALYETCCKVYPDQGNPLQVTALVKYWLGGPDPLDYISMYSNPGNPTLNVPPHWHYVSFGLSDLHGDGRVHEDTSQSGYGFEMTFRLKREEGETAPPTWPAKLLQTLARYVFQTGKTLCAGDYASWHHSLDHSSDSAMRHMLMTEDPQLGSCLTPHGEVQFVQIVGVCVEEVKAAQQWSVPGVLNILKHLNGVGGQWLVTDMRRRKTMQELNPICQTEIDRGIRLEGSNLSGVSTRYMRTGPIVLNELGEVLNRLNGDINSDFNGINTHNKHPFSYDQRSPMPMGGGPEYPSEPNMNRLHVHDSLHLKLDSEAGSLLSLALRGRVLHGRPFTFNAILDEQAVILLPPSMGDPSSAVFVTPKSPYVRCGPWTQLLVPVDFASEMATSLEVLTLPEVRTSLPRTFYWPDRKLAITIECDSYIDSLKAL